MREIIEASRSDDQASFETRAVCMMVRLPGLFRRSDASFRRGFRKALSRNALQLRDKPDLIEEGKLKISRNWPIESRYFSYTTLDESRTPSWRKIRKVYYIFSPHCDRCRSYAEYSGFQNHSGV
jgi:hypothetical protein